MVSATDLLLETDAEEQRKALDDRAKLMKDAMLAAMNTSDTGLAAEIDHINADASKLIHRVLRDETLSSAEQEVPCPLARLVWTGYPPGP